MKEGRAKIAESNSVGADGVKGGRTAAEKYIGGWMSLSRAFYVYCQVYCQMYRGFAISWKRDRR